jgi:hypothetical protein
MFIGERHDKTVKAIALELVAKRGKAVGISGHG